MSRMRTQLKITPRKAARGSATARPNGFLEVKPLKTPRKTSDRSGVEPIVQHTLSPTEQGILDLIVRGLADPEEPGLRRSMRGLLEQLDNKSTTSPMLDECRKLTRETLTMTLRHARAGMQSRVA